MKFFTYLKKPRTAAQITKHLGCTDSNTRAYLRRYSKQLKTVGTKKTKGKNGPAPVLYVLRKNAKTPAKRLENNFKASFEMNQATPREIEAILQEQGVITNVETTPQTHQHPIEGVA